MRPPTAVDPTRDSCRRALGSSMACHSFTRTSLRQAAGGFLRTMQRFTAGCPAPFEHHVVIALSRALEEHNETPGLTILNGVQGKAPRGHIERGTGGHSRVGPTAVDLTCKSFWRALCSALASRSFTP